MNQNKITLALFLAGAAHAAQGPSPTLDPTTTQTNHLYVWGSNKLPVTSNTEAKAAVEDGSKTTGLYGCVRSGMLALAPQHMKVDSGVNAVVPLTTTQQTNLQRVFYPLTDLANGTPPTLVPESTGAAGDNYPTTAGANMPWFTASTGAAYTQADNSGKKSGDVGLLFDNYTLECCNPHANTIKTNTCLTAVTPTWVAANEGDPTTEATIDNRVAIFSTPATYGNAAEHILLKADGTTAIFNDGLHFSALATDATDLSAYHPDFILGAMGQRSDNVAADGNWCSHAYLYDFGAGTPPTSSEIKASEGFNKKTKCTWQLKSKDDNGAPQFKLTKADDINFHIQWIETSVIASLADNSILSDVNTTIGGTTLKGLIGTYADALYFNPVIQGFVHDNATPTATDVSYQSASAGSINDTTAVSMAFNGSAGNVRLFYPDTATTHVLSGDLNLGTYMSEYMTIQGLWANYKTAADNFNTLVATYNTDLKKWQDAVKEGKTDVSKPADIPCPPTKPSFADGITFVTNDAKLSEADQKAAAQSNQANKMAAYYRGYNSAATDAISDSRRWSKLYNFADFASQTTLDANHSVGHVFGRLGQGKNNMPDVFAPFRFKTTNATKQVMNVSIFPETGLTALAATKEIVIDVSEKTLVHDAFQLPSEVSVSLTPIDNSAMTIGASIAVASAAIAATLF